MLTVYLYSPGDQTYSAGNWVSLDFSGSDSDMDALTYTATGLPSWLTIDGSSGSISGTVPGYAATNGTPYSISVTATDTAANVSASQIIDVTVTAPTVYLYNPGTLTNSEGDLVNLALSATDSAGDSLEYTAVNLPQGLVLDYTTGVVSGTIWNGASLSGPYSVTVTATDSMDPNAGASQSFTWDVNPVVTLANPGSATGADGDTVYLPLTASDSAGNAVNYSATGLPAGLSIDPATGIISGTVSVGDNMDSPYSVTVTATDSVDTNASASQPFQWTINPTGTITVSLTQPANQTNYEGDSVDLALSASDSAENVLVYAAVNLPPGLVLNPSTGVISGTIDDYDSLSGPYTVTVSATDSTNSSVGAYQTFTWSVNPLVTLAVPDSAANADGDTVYLPLDAGDSAGNALSFTQSGLPTGLSINPATGAISGTVSAGDDADSPYTVTVTATDSVTGADVSESFQWTISASGTVTVSLAQPGDQDSLEEGTVNLQMTATDSAGNVVVYQANNLPAGLTIDPSTGLISGTVDDGDSVEGPYTVTVSATDGNNFTVGASQTFQWSIAPVVTLANPGAQTNADGDTVYLSLLATDSSEDLNFTATNLPAGLSIDPSTGAVSGNVVAGADAGSPYNVTVTATDANSGASTTQAFQWTVNPAGTVTVSLVQPPDQSYVEGQSVNLALSATDSAGNALIYNAPNLPDGLIINQSTGLITGTVDDGDSLGGPYTVTVSANDSVNPSVGTMQTFMWNVVPQVTLANPGSLSNADGDTVELGLVTTDSAGDTVTYTASNLPPGLTINPWTGVISGTVAAGADAGSPYNVTVTVTDVAYANATATVPFAWTIAATGTVTVSFTQTSAESTADGDTVNLTVAATDSAGHALSYTALNLPYGLTLNPATGVISGTFTAGDWTSSPYTVKIVASDAGNPSVGSSESFQWTVSPTLGLSVPDVVSESNGQQVNWTFTSNNANLTPLAAEAAAAVNAADDPPAAANRQPEPVFVPPFTVAQVVAQLNQDDVFLLNSFGGPGRIRIIDSWSVFQSDSAIWGDAGTILIRPRGVFGDRTAAETAVGLANLLRQAANARANERIK